MENSLPQLHIIWRPVEFDSVGGVPALQEEYERLIEANGYAWWTQRLPMSYIRLLHHIIEQGQPVYLYPLEDPREVGTNVFRLRARINKVLFNDDGSFLPQPDNSLPYQRPTDEKISSSCWVQLLELKELPLEQRPNPANYVLLPYGDRLTETLNKNFSQGFIIRDKEYLSFRNTRLARRLLTLHEVSKPIIGQSAKAEHALGTVSEETRERVSGETSVGEVSINMVNSDVSLPLDEILVERVANDRSSGELKVNTDDHSLLVSNPEELHDGKLHSSGEMTIKLDNNDAQVTSQRSEEIFKLDKPLISEEEEEVVDERLLDLGIDWEVLRRMRKKMAAISHQDEPAPPAKLEKPAGESLFAPGELKEDLQAISALAPKEEEEIEFIAPISEVAPAAVTPKEESATNIPSIDEVVAGWTEALTTEPTEDAPPVVEVKPVEKPTDRIPSLDEVVAEWKKGQAQSLRAGELPVVSITPVEEIKSFAGAGPILDITAVEPAVGNAPVETDSPSLPVAETIPGATTPADSATETVAEPERMPAPAHTSDELSSLPAEEQPFPDLPPLAEPEYKVAKAVETQETPRSDKLLIPTVDALLAGVEAREKRQKPVDEVKERTLALPRDVAEAIKRIQDHLVIDNEQVAHIITNLLLGKHVIIGGPTGSGKTTLARLLPSLIWNIYPEMSQALSGWDTDELLGSVYNLPDGGVAVSGILTRAVLKNYSSEDDGYSRASYRASNGAVYDGVWLVLDELDNCNWTQVLGDFLASCDAPSLNISAANTPDETINIPIPKDFRLLATFNDPQGFLDNSGLSQSTLRRVAYVELRSPSNEEDERQAVRQKVQTTVYDQLGLATKETALSGQLEDTLFRLIRFIRCYQDIGTAPLITILADIRVEVQMGLDAWHTLDEAISTNILPLLRDLSVAELRLIGNLASNTPERILAFFASNLPTRYSEESFRSQLFSFLTFLHKTAVYRKDPSAEDFNELRELAGAVISRSDITKLSTALEPREGSLAGALLPSVRLGTMLYETIRGITQQINMLTR